MTLMDRAVLTLAAIIAGVLYGLGYLHGRGHRFIDRLFHNEPPSEPWRRE